MAALLSSSIALAVTSVTVGHPASDRTPVEAGLPMSSAGEAGAEPVVKIAPGYVIVDIPASNLARREQAPDQLHDVESDVAANVARAPDNAARASPFHERPASAEFDDAVLAQHDERIALLKQRIETIRVENPLGPDEALSDLTARLRKAEAARELSAQRAAARSSCCEDVRRSIEAPADEAREAREKSSVIRGAAESGPAAVLSRRANDAGSLASKQGPATNKRAEGRAKLKAAESAALSMLANPNPIFIDKRSEHTSDGALHRSSRSLATARHILELGHTIIAGPTQAADRISLQWYWWGPLQQFVLALASLLIVLGAAQRMGLLSPAYQSAWPLKS